MVDQVNNRKLQLILFWISCNFLFSCSYKKLDIEPCTGQIPDTVSFSNNLLPMFRSHCSTSGCHAGSMPAGNLNLEDGQAYSQLHQPGRGYINTNKPEFSVLYTEMISTTQPMPPTGNLNECETGKVLKWIEQGAKNN